MSYPVGADPWREAPLALPLGELAARTGCLRGCRALNGTMLDVIPLNWALAKIRDFGRLIAAPTVQVRKLVPFIQPHPPQLRVRSAAFNHGMIAPGNHNFERFAALCNTPKGAPRALRARACAKRFLSGNEPGG